jgi:hypothetical protein
MNISDSMDSVNDTNRLASGFGSCCGEPGGEAVAKRWEQQGGLLQEKLSLGTLDLRAGAQEGGWL